MHSLKEAGGSLAASAAASAAATLDMGLALGHSAPVTYTVSVVKTNLEARVQARWTVTTREIWFMHFHCTSQLSRRSHRAARFFTLSYLYIITTAATHPVLIRCTNATPTSGHCTRLCSVNHAKLPKPQMRPPTPRATAAVLLEWTAPMALLQLRAPQIIHRRARRVVPLLLLFHHLMLCPHFRQSAR